jgi:quercetin dioxygenase-like cupin family protein
VGYGYCAGIEGRATILVDLVSEKEGEMLDRPSETTQPASTIPPDNPQRRLAAARPDTDQTLPHVGVVGDTYTILLTGKDTAGRFCLIDMYVPPGGGPPPHRHDFEEAFIVLDGEVEAVFRGNKQTVRAGETINVPANAPHQFHNSSAHPARLLCICAPSGQEEFFLRVGVPVATRTTPPPRFGEAAQRDFRAKAVALAPRYRTEVF